MAATNHRPPPVARTPNASASAGSDTSRQARGEAGKQDRAGATPSSVGSIPDWLSSLEGPRKLVINALVVIVGLLGSGVVVKASLKQLHVVDTISVPGELEAEGYTAVTVGQRIIDAVKEINRDAAMTKRIGIYTLSEADALKPDSADYESPGRTDSPDSSFTLTRDDPSKKYDVSVGGVSLTTIILYVRELFGQSDTRISGEITVAHPPAVGAGGKDEKAAPKKFSIRLRISDKGHVQQEGEASDQLETLFEQVALKLVERFDPLNAGYYSYYKRDYDNALRIVRAYLADRTKIDKEWASNLLGLIEHARYRYDAAGAEKGYEKAVAEFTKLTESDPRFAPGLYNLSFVLIDQGYRHLKRQDQEAARKLFSQAREVALQSIGIDAAADKAGRERAAGYATAGRALRALARLDPANYDQALHYFDSSIEADPMFIYAYLSEGRIHALRRVPDDATARYQLATEINPSAQTFTRVGNALRRDGRHADAVPMFRKAAELKPSANAYTYWGMAVRDAGHHQEAKELFERAIKTDPNGPNAYNQLGLLYLKLDKWDEAAEKFAKASELSPEWSNYPYNLGLALRRAGKLEQAIAAFEKAITIYQSHAWSYAQLGATLAQLDRRDRGTVSAETARKVEQNLQRAIELEPGDRKVLRVVGEAYEFLDRPEEAFETYRRAFGAGEGAEGGLEADIERVGRAIGAF